jgi:hypothetical protein
VGTATDSPQRTSDDRWAHLISTLLSSGIIAVGSSAENFMANTRHTGYAAVFELAHGGGGTYPWELLQWMLSDSSKAEGSFPDRDSGRKGSGKLKRTRSYLSSI